MFVVILDLCVFLFTFVVFVVLRRFALVHPPPTLVYEDSIGTNSVSGTGRVTDATRRETSLWSEIKNRFLYRYNSKSHEYEAPSLLGWIIKTLAMDGEEVLARSGRDGYLYLRCVSNRMQAAAGINKHRYQSIEHQYQSIEQQYQQASISTSIIINKHQSLQLTIPVDLSRRMQRLYIVMLSIASVVALAALLPIYINGKSPVSGFSTLTALHLEPGVAQLWLPVRRAIASARLQCRAMRNADRLVD